MKNRQALVRGWFLKADSDLADARRTIASEGPYDTACFHAQQAAEKYLKGYLAWLGNPIPRAHDLVHRFISSMTTLRQAQGHPEGNRGTNLFPQDLVLREHPALNLRI